jgi:hypothetical protein
LQHRADQARDNGENEDGFTSLSGGKSSDSREGEQERGEIEATGEAATKAALQKLGPSFLSLDTDGRVLRIDSFSKVHVGGNSYGHQ